MRGNVCGSAAALIVTGCLAAMPGCVATGGGSSSRVEPHHDSKGIAVIFSNEDRRAIGSYYARHRKTLPPGLARKKYLPPGLERQVERNGQLPPGLRSAPLPHDLEHRLQPLQDGYVRVRVGADVVLMNRETRLVLDVIRNVAH